jgi:hypothetical protein
VSAAPGPKTRLGALLLRKGLVSPVELEDALETQRTKGGLLGEILVRSGLASRPAIEDALAEQVGHRVEFEAGFGSGLRSQIANRRPRRSATTAHPHAPAPAQALAVAPAPRPVLEAVPDVPEEPEEPEVAEEIAVVHELHAERHDDPDLTAELLQQAERWQRVADDLREERDAVRDALAASERARVEAEVRLAALDELQREPEREPVTAHVVFLQTGAGYTLVPADGPPPEPGTRLELEQRDYVVLKLGPSPFPGDDRPCAFVEPA